MNASVITNFNPGSMHCFRKANRNNLFMRCDMANTETQENKPKVKKSVALSGVVAGNTALCTVGRSGNDLHYRGYDILDLAETSEFEEIAHLIIHGKR